MIDDNSVAVLVKYGESHKLIEQVRAVGPKRMIMRKLQRFTVNVPREMLRGVLSKGFVEEVTSGVYAQTLNSLYSDQFGFDLYREGFSPEEFMS